MTIQLDYARKYIVPIISITIIAIVNIIGHVSRFVQCAECEFSSLFQRVKLQLVWDRNSGI